ncbi:uncharacterized protein EI90DRAFT_1020586 [Cantharellus anzutake]|uniref:uncharacterized protein n=1 Tax=Cantharellus anzutake TaxID=1750568 RepID=UPI0019085180|nr:uncharacterized protein EI90DRAFT_1020586 [Cantharellus anzutake]KAF8331424.1 hypothetical protein EI90DRAFT_1020586 [Cantharellus anzutake]
MCVKSKSECLERTRVQIQASLLEHLKIPENRFTWLRGPPGTGKTAICMSVASTLNSEAVLAASFFWDKNQAGTGLNSIEHFPSTLAYQLAVFNEDFKMSLVKHLRQPSSGFVKSLPLDKQMSVLIIEPMRDVIEMLPSGRIRFVIILDGLDECGNPMTLKSLMELVLKLHDLPSSFAVLVSSRPETQVIRAWSRAQSKGHVILCEDTNTIDKKMDLDTFTSACRELPIIASLRIREICDRTELGATLKLEFDYFRNLMDAPTDLNSEYLRILRRAYTLESSPVRPNVIENYRLVVGTIAVAREPLSLHSIAQLLGITEDEVYATLRPIGSIVDLPSTGEGRPKFYHATAKEFIVGHPISGTCDHPFFIDKDGSFLGLPLLRFLRGLAIPTNRPLGDEKKWRRFQRKRQPEHIQYAVKYLFNHLDSSKLFSQDSNELQQEFDHFLTHNLLWFIVLLQGEFTLLDKIKFLHSNNNDYGSTQLLREAGRVNEYVVDRYHLPALPRVTVHPSHLPKTKVFYPWQIFRSMLPFTPTSSLLFKSYSHLSDPVRIFSISGEFAGHLIPLSEHALSARKIMETKLRRLPREQQGYKAEFLDPDIREGTVTSAAISKDGCHIALGFGNGGIEVVDIDQQHSITRFQCDSYSPPVWIEFISAPEA